MQRRGLCLATSLSLTLAACSASPDAGSDDGSDAGFVQASASTQHDLGVVRWSTKNAPSDITGLDASDQVVVELKHDATASGNGTTHAYALRDHERQSVVQFWLGTNEMGAETFALRGERYSENDETALVLAHMQQDLGSVAGPGLTSQSLSGDRLRPQDDTPPKLVCSADMLLVNGAQTCLTLAKEKQWEAACAKAAKHAPGAKPEEITCWEQGDGKFNDCICIDNSNSVTSGRPISCTVLQKMDNGGPSIMTATIETCHYSQGNGFETNSCGKQCRTSEKKCETSTVSPVMEWDCPGSTWRPAK